MKVLYLDIETAPLQAYTWGLWQQNIGINQIIKPTEMICFAAKFRGEKKKHFYSIHHHGKQEMVEQAHCLLDEADVLKTWNGKTFDEPHLRREMLLAGLNPPSPLKHVDLFQVAKRQFRWPSNKLQYVSTALGLDGKVAHSGFDLWVKCLSDDPAAWRKMKTYNIQDVVLLEELDQKLLPWTPNPPSVTLHDGIENGCDRCGSTHLQSRGYSITQLGKYRRYQCQSCGGWLRSGKRVDSVDLRGVR